MTFMAEEFDLELTSGRLHAQRFGEPDAPLLLAVHGLSANMHGFDYLAPLLIADGDRQVVALDLRGRGGSQVTPPGTYGLRSHARDVFEVATTLGHDQFDWVGWSLGALMGIVAAQMEPGRIRTLGLIDHAGRSDERAVAAVIAGLDRLELEVPDAAAYVAHVEAVSPIRPFTDFWRRFYAYEFRRTNKAACLEDGRDAAGQDWPQAWRDLAVPVALVRCRQPLGGGLVVPDDIAADIASNTPGLTVADVDADHFTVMTHAPAAEALRALVV
jgi:pimeloyl-ACP methyl ester carboxylesterase